MNREGTPEAPGIRLDPEPEKTAAEADPTQIVRRGAPEAAPPEQPSEAPDPTNALRRMEEDQKEQRAAEEDAKFLEDYQGVDLMQMIMHGYVQHTVEIFKGMTVTLRTITEDEDDEIVTDLEGQKEASQLRINNQIGRIVLAYAIVAINEAPFGSDLEERKTRIGKMGKPIKLAIWEEFQKLNKAVGMMIRGGRSGNSLVHRLIGQDLIY